MCAEIGTMTWAQSLFRDEGHIPTSARVQWSVYGVTSHVTGQTGFLPPCSDAGAPGCATYVDQLARAVGGGGRCLTRREPEPAPPIRPHRQDTDTPDAPITPGTPPKTGRPTNKDDPESPTRLGQNQQKPKDDPDAPAKEKGGFERGAVCSLPNRAGIKPKVTKRDIWGARAGLFGMH